VKLLPYRTTGDDVQGLCRREKKASSERRGSHEKNGDEKKQQPGKEKMDILGVQQRLKKEEAQLTEEK